MKPDRKIIAIIPARSNSKRIPNKNFIDFFGIPIIAWTIKAAIDSKIFDNIYVSTDSLEIAEIAKKYNASVFIRDNFIDDISPVSDATIYTAKGLKLDSNDIIFQLMPNCPLRTSDDILKIYNFYLTLKNFNSVISCFKFGWMNPWWAMKKDGDKYLPLFKDFNQRRSQDLESLYCPSGAVWVADLKSLVTKKSFYTGDHTFFEVPLRSALDIDDYEDLEMAKSLFLSH